MVSAFEPTDVAYAFATSFAPIPIAAMNENMPPAMTIHVYIYTLYHIFFIFIVGYKENTKNKTTKIKQIKIVLITYKWRNDL